MAQLKQVIWGDYETVGTSWEYFQELQSYRESYGYFVLVFGGDVVAGSNINNEVYDIYINEDPELSINLYLEGEVTEQNNPEGYEVVGYYQAEENTSMNVINSLTFKLKPGIKEAYLANPGSYESNVWTNVDEDPVTFYDVPPPPPPVLDETYRQPYALDWNVRELTDAIFKKHGKLQSEVEKNKNNMLTYGLGVTKGAATRYSERDTSLKSGLYGLITPGSGAVLLLPGTNKMMQLFMYDINNSIPKEESALIMVGRGDAYIRSTNSNPVETYYAGVRSVNLTAEEKRSGLFVYTRNQMDTQITTNAIKAGPASFSKGWRKLEGYEFGVGYSSVGITIGVPAENVISITAKVYCTNGEIHWKNHAQAIRRFTVTLQSNGTLSLTKEVDSTILDSARIVLYIEEEL